MGLNTCINGLIDNNFYVMKQNNRRFDFSEKKILCIYKKTGYSQILVISCGISDAFSEYSAHRIVFKQAGTGY